MVALIAIAAIAFLLLLFLFAAVKVAREYERGVIFRLGRLLPEPKGPGLFLLIPIVDRMVKVDLRTITLNVPPQEVITKDNVPVRVNAVAYFRIVEPKNAIVQVENFMVATSQIAQTTLRSVLGQHVLDELLSERDKINAILQNIIDEATSPWGIKVSIVEVKDVEIPATMQRAMARQAEAERERRAKVIAAEGEFQASQKLSEAADVMSKSPMALQLRYLQTLLEIGATNATTIVFPAPIDMLTAFMGKAAGEGGGVELDDELAVGGAEAAGGLDRGAQVQALVLGLLDQHDGLERLDVVDPLLLALRRDLRLVRPVVELHLRDAGDLADLAQIELDLVEMLREVDWLENVDLCVVSHADPSIDVYDDPSGSTYTRFSAVWEEIRAENVRFELRVRIRRGGEPVLVEVRLRERLDARLHGGVCSLADGGVGIGALHHESEARDLVLVAA